MEKSPNTRGIDFEQEDQFPRSTQGTSWFFGIGINQYMHFPHLVNAVKDVEDVAETLIELYDLEEKNSFFLFNEEANEENIVDRLDKLVEMVQENDKLIIYYSGHGFMNKNTELGYWIPYDAQKEKTSRYLRNSTIRDYIKVIKSRHTLLISDSCFSGSLFSRGGHRSTAAVQDLESRQSRWAICSGRADEEVYDGEPGQNSPFATSIMDTLRTTQSKCLNVAKLADQVVIQTRNNYEQLPEGNPLYGVGDKGGQYVFWQKANEQEDWTRCEEEGTLKAYEFFLQKHPDGTFAGKAAQKVSYFKEEALWQKAQQANTKWAYIEYDQKYPSGRYAHESIQALEKIEEGEAWNKAKRQHTHSGYRKYILNFPQGTHLTEARELLEKLGAAQQEPKDWSNATQRNSLVAYQEYVQKYPAGQFVEEARTRIQVLEAAEAREKEEKKASRMVEHQAQLGTTPVIETVPASPMPVETVPAAPVQKIPPASVRESQPAPVRPLSQSYAPETAVSQGPGLKKHLRWAVPALVVLIAAIWGIISAGGDASRPMTNAQAIQAEQAAIVQTEQSAPPKEISKETSKVEQKPQTQTPPPAPQRKYTSDEWRRTYFKPVKQGTFNVIVASLGQISASRADQLLANLQRKYPQFHFRLVATVARDGSSNAQYAIFMGNGLSSKEANAAVNIARSYGVAKDAYKAPQDWDTEGPYY